MHNYYVCIVFTPFSLIFIGGLSFCHENTMNEFSNRDQVEPANVNTAGTNVQRTTKYRIPGSHTNGCVCIYKVVFELLSIEYII